MTIAFWIPFSKKGLDQPEDFIVETIPNFVRRGSDEKFFLLTDTAPAIQITFPGNTETIITKPPQPNILLKKIWWDVKLPAVLKKIKADLFISFAYDCSLTAAIPQFIVVYDAKRLTTSRIKKARLVFVMSESIKAELAKKHKTVKEKIVVVYPAPGREYSLVDADIREGIKEKFSQGKEFFLCNGGFKNRGDLIELLKSFSHFKKRQQSNFKLLLLAESTPFFEKTLSAYKYRNDVAFIATKDKNIQAAITGSAYAVVLPFNTNEDMIAALNAMRSAVPVITIKSSVINEVAGDAALYAENEIKDIGEKMIQLYTNENFRSALIEKGRERVKGFTHEKAAEVLWQSIIKDYKMI